MKQDYNDLLKPELIKTISGLALIARVIVDGYLSGVNHSRRVGPGMEFSQYRSYQSGDDLRLLDWKMLARSGRYYIKQSEIETNISIKFILDASNSMLHEENGLSKMDYVRVLVASLAYLSQNQGDAVGLFALNDKELHSVYPKVQKQHFNRLLHELINIENHGKWPENETESRKLHDRTHKELIFFITDMYENNEELTRFVKKLKNLKNEVIVLHIMGANELDFDYKGNVTFEDLETGTKLKVNTAEAKKMYLQSLENMIKNTKDFLLANNIGYHLFRLDEPMGEAIQLFLKKRNNLV
ncbi:DUF58 domain-containing protein [Flavobacteriaceae bacterium S0825]|uniref:DUF58 domain-containing protein n=1 Tax=Gaetbulibacter sp. S0825 TaxID=2720084 RepID=UPI00142F5240|nr:DUF58 domain-containing protein [Gaetbulibacter sp. S0825]MCK0107759.1 DUF58 domain-containing protein [Flavobacteriaceae bacterium S0825]NIX63395.1 DUF58 domain-containing protein [Gaetbulibacter sp. S0825]